MTLGRNLACMLACLGLGATGCATMISGTTETLKLSSEPSGAAVKVEPGFFTVTTPNDLAVKREDGPYRLTFSKDGYKPCWAHVDATTNPWVWGNVVSPFGVLIDYVTGAATSFEPTDIHVVLKQVPQASSVQSPVTEDC